MSFIETERLLIRTWMPGDAAKVEKMYADPDVMRYIGAGGPWTPQQTHELIGAMIERYERTGIGIWPVVLKEGGVVIGACGLQPLPNSNDIEIGYLLDRPYWGQGYAYEAANAVSNWGFNQHGLQRITAVVSPENPRSIAVIYKLGMHFERVVRAYKHDLLKYARAKTYPA